MKHFLICLLLLCGGMHVSGQDCYYMRMAQKYQNEAEYYTKQAMRYEREVEYYNKRAQGYLREAEYYSRHKNYDKVKTYQRWDVDATEKAESNSRYARKARERAQDYMRKAKNMLQKAK